MIQFPILAWEKFIERGDLWKSYLRKPAEITPNRAVFGTVATVVHGLLQAALRLRT
jgi:hypothetical protein